MTKNEKRAMMGLYNAVANLLWELQEADLDMDDNRKKFPHVLRVDRAMNRAIKKLT